MLIAIDHGNYNIKTPHHSFMAGLAEHSVRPPMADEILEYNGSFWTLSGKRLNYRRDKTKDESYFILSLFAIARELLHTGSYSAVEKIHLAVGLPPEHYGILRDKFAQYFKRSHSIHFVYNDKPFTILIGNVYVYPQAYAAIAPQKSQMNHHLRVFLVDIGGYTTDVLLLRNGKPDMQFCRSLEMGVITMNNDIIRRVGALHDMRIEDEHISAILSGKETILPEDVKKTIRESAGHHAKDILDKLRELQVDLRSNPAVFIGGGSVLYRDTEEEAKYIISCLDNESMMWKALVMFMIDSGCRRGEVVGLMWDAVDLTTGEVKIFRNAQYTSGKGTYITTTKNRKNRVLYLNPTVLSVMREWKREQARYLLAQGYPREGYCFTRENGKVLNPQAPTSYLARFGKKYGIQNLHPHALRHTMATISIANGADIVSVSEKLGHSETSVTLDVYSHVNKKAQKRANQILSQALYTPQNESKMQA